MTNTHTLINYAFNIHPLKTASNYFWFVSFLLLSLLLVLLFGQLKLLLDLKPRAQNFSLLNTVVDFLFTFLLCHLFKSCSVLFVSYHVFVKAVVEFLIQVNFRVATVAIRHFPCREETCTERSILGNIMKTFLFIKLHKITTIKRGDGERG